MGLTAPREAMWPIRDVNPTSRRPLMTQAIIIANVIMFMPVFYAWITGDDALYEWLICSFGLIPSHLLALKDLHTLITSMFMHADIFHILFNMLFLRIFGDNVEDVLGRASYLVLYILWGLAAVGLHVLICLVFSPFMLDIPLVGASGAISGVLGAYVVFFPRARILTAIAGYYTYYTTEIRAIHYIGIWFVFQLIYGLLALGLPFLSVAYWAHIGGFLAGVLVALPLREQVRYRAGLMGWRW
ncbi:rhomboid family intramembrane serine protease [Candidatus Bathyarchaeota archaeon]|nr:MAG: rhomboid family intramembrane serine protease [Candidatus Bathyarchaeota archaeon]